MALFRTTFFTKELLKTLFLGCKMYYSIETWPVLGYGVCKIVVVDCERRGDMWTEICGGAVVKGEGLYVWLSYERRLDVCECVGGV